MTSKVNAPNGKQRTEVLECLWKHSKPAIWFERQPNGNEIRIKQEGAAWQNRGKIEQLLKEKPFVDYYGGRCIKTNFSEFPEMNLSDYKHGCNIPLSYNEIFQSCFSEKSS